MGWTTGIKHILIAILVIAALVAGIFCPYIRGDYDYFAVGLSYIVQSGSFAALLFVPVGIVWLTLNLSKGRARREGKYAHYLKRAGLVIAVITILFAALGAFAAHNRFSAIIILAIGMLIVVFRKKITTLFSVPQQVHPYYYIVIPLTVFFTRMYFLETAKHASTSFVIQQSGQLIHDIEAYKTANGYYPVSLLSTIEDYHPGVSGIPRFHYERNGDAYNIYFLQTSDVPGTEEVVMYNKAGEHQMTVHNQDLLRISPQNILRGYHKQADLPQPHWKVFYFD